MWENCLPFLNPEIFLPLNTKIQEIDLCSILFLANMFLSDVILQLKISFQLRITFS